MVATAETHLCRWSGYFEHKDWVQRKRAWSEDNALFLNCLERCEIDLGWALDVLCTPKHARTRVLPPFKLRALFTTMNLSLYSVNAFIILDSEGHRVLAKYYRPKGNPQDSLTPKDQRTFEKGLWQKTKKPGGTTRVLPSCATHMDARRCDPL